MLTMRAVQVTSASGPFELVQRAIPKPARGQVRIRIQACGVCHSDAFTKTGAFPGIRYPRARGLRPARSDRCRSEGNLGSTRATADGCSKR
jgi:cytochrome c553